MAVNIGVPGLGATQALTQGAIGYGQGEIQARQLAYMLALRNLMMQEKVGNIEANRARAGWFNTESQRAGDTASANTAEASAYRQQYNYPAEMPDSEVLRRGRLQVQTEGKAHAPPSPALGFQQARQNRANAIRAAAGDAAFFVHQQGGPGTKAQIQPVIDSLKVKYPKLDLGTLRGIATQAVTPKGGASKVSQLLLSLGSFAADTAATPGEETESPAAQPTDAGGAPARGIPVTRAQHDSLRKVLGPAFDPRQYEILGEEP